MRPQTGFYALPRSLSHSFDFYPAPAPSAPLLIYLHGGAWRFGDKDSFRLSENGSHRLREVFQHAGFACVSINYRLSSEALFPAQINDVKAAIRFFRTRSRQFGLDPSRFVIAGSSAGGHLAMLAAASGNPDPYYEGLTPRQLSGEVSSGLAAAVSFYGVSDLRTIFTDRPLCGVPSHHPDDDGAEWRLLGSTYPAPAGSTAELNWKLAQPLDLVREAEPAGSRRCAPLFLLHGLADSCVPYLQSVRVFEQAIRRRIPSRLILVEGAEHSDPRCYSASHLQEILDWVREQIYPISEKGTSTMTLRWPLPVPLLIDRELSLVPWPQVGRVPGVVDDLVASCKDEHMVAFTQVPHNYTRSMALSFLADTGSVRWGLVVDHRYCGNIELRLESTDEGSVSLGYNTAPYARRRGLMSRAVKMVVKHAFSQGVCRLELRAAVNNRASRAVAESTGFIFEGVVRGAEYLHGELIDLAVYSRRADRDGF